MLSVLHREFRKRELCYVISCIFKLEKHLTQRRAGRQDFFKFYSPNKDISRQKGSAGGGGEEVIILEH